MARAAREITARFDRFVSSQALSAILNCIFDGHKSAYEECERAFDKTELKNILPLYRWAKINSLLRALPESFGVIVTAELNKTRNSYHTLIVAGGVKMTHSSIESRNDMARGAIFRETYAEEAQLSLFGDNTSGDDEESLYGLILHAPAANQKEPQFVDIAFPDKDYEQYVGEKVDLFRRFPDIVASRKVQTEEAVAAEPQVKPRRRVAKKKEKSA